MKFEEEFLQDLHKYSCDRLNELLGGALRETEEQILLKMSQPERPNPETPKGDAMA